MRGILLVFAVALTAHAAHAGKLVVMTEHNGVLGAALDVALANRGVHIAPLPPPTGSLRLDRAAAAQRAALDAGAEAAIWIDRDGALEVCVVSADGRDFRHAPFNDVSPRTFAAIATSLLDELFAPEDGFTVDVDVRVTPSTPTPTPEPTLYAMPPGFARPVVASITPPPGMVDAAPVVATQYPARHDRTQFEIGPILSPVTAGIEANVMFPASPFWRVGVMATVDRPFDSSIAKLVYGGAVELRHIGSGKERHYDVGVLAGGASDGKDPVAFTGLRLSLTWEGPTGCKSLGLSPLLVITGSDGDPIMPGIFASFRWGFSL